MTKIAAALMVLAGMAVSALLQFTCTSTLAQSPGSPTAEQVRELQGTYKAERAAVVSSGLAKKFSPDWLGQADQLAQKGDAALTAGKLMEAEDAYRRALAAPLSAG